MNAIEENKDRCPQCGGDIEGGELCESCEEQNNSERLADILQDDMKYSDQ